MTDPDKIDDQAAADPDDLETTRDQSSSNTVGPSEDSLEISAFDNEIADSDDELVVETSSNELGEGDCLGKYEIKKLLGRGGMGAVYLGFDPLIEREVAIKVLPTQSGNSTQAFDRFLAEARATGKLNHPNVVAIYDINQESGTSYIVMELVRGGSGSDYITNRDEIDWLDSIRVVANAADGLAAAHRSGLVHRDIKPDNLMLTEENVAKVVDFGLSKLVDSASDQNLNLTTEGQLLGTPRFMSPEQFQGGVVDARSDVYCLGGTLFTFLTGQFPYANANNMVAVMRAHVDDPPPDPVESNQELPTEIRSIVSRAMAKDPEDRYQDSGELASALWEIYQRYQKVESAESTMQYRTCANALVVEPSRMQAMMLAKQLEQNGIENIKVCYSAKDAKTHCESNVPDLIISALQLDDLDGVRLLEILSHNQELSRAVFVLNTTDVDLEKLVALRLSSPLAVVSKKTKPVALLKSLYACTHLEFSNLETQPSIDTSVFRLGIVSDTMRIPDSIANLIRESNLLDISISTFDQLAADRAAMPQRDLVVALRYAGETIEDNRVYAELIERTGLDCQRQIAVQIVEDEMKLRSWRLGDFMASTRVSLDRERWNRILVSCSE